MKVAVTHKVFCVIQLLPILSLYLKKSNSSSFNVFLFLFFNKLSYLPPVNSAPNCVTELYTTFKSFSYNNGFDPYLLTYDCAVGKSFESNNPLIQLYCVVSLVVLAKFLRAELKSGLSFDKRLPILSSAVPLHDMKRNVSV